MAWVRVDEKFSRGPKVKRAARILGGRNGRARVLAVWLDAMSYCNLNLTDGEFPDDELDTLPDADPVSVFEAMARGDDARGPMVERRAAGWFFCNYGDYQPLKAEIEAKLERDRKRKKDAKDSKLPERGSRADSAEIPRGTIADSAHTEPDRTGPFRSEPNRPREIQINQIHRRAARAGLDVDEHTSERDLRRLVALCHADLVRPYVTLTHRLPDRDGLVAALMAHAAARTSLTCTNAQAQAAVDRALARWASRRSA